MIQLSEQFVPIKLNAEKGGKDAATKYSVHGYPTILFVDGDGNVVVKTAGYRPPADFSKLLNQVLDLKHVPEWEAALKSDPQNIDAIANLGIAAALKDDQKTATDYAQKAMALKPTTNAQKGALADLFNNVGDSYQNGNQPDKAIPFFEAAANSGAETSKIAYALFSEGYCYLMMNKAKEALDMANKAAALPGLSKDDADTVAALKASATKALGGG